MSKNERVKEAFNHLKKNRIVSNQSDFSRLLSKHKSYISEIFNGSREVSKQFVLLLCSTFPDINPDWILNNEGEMLLPSKNRYAQLSEKEIEDIIESNVLEVLMSQFKAGEIYSAEVYNKMVAEKDRRIEELQREVWVLQQKVDEMSR